jgi:hypothetical protein
VLGYFFETFEKTPEFPAFYTFARKKNQAIVTGTVAFVKVLLETIASITTRACTSRSGQGGRQLPRLLIALTAKVQN